MFIDNTYLCGDETINRNWSALRLGGAFTDRNTDVVGSRIHDGCKELPDLFGKGNFRGV